MMPSKVTDLLPQSIAQWFSGRRSAGTANGSVPAEPQPPPEREEERVAAPPAKRARYHVDVSNYYAQTEQPTVAPPRPDPEPLAGPSGGYRPPEPPASPPPRAAAPEEPRFGRSAGLFGGRRSVTRLNLGRKGDGEAGRSKVAESPLKPSSSSSSPPVKQTSTVSGSTFYPGRTMYGGASASSMYLYAPNIRERRVAVPSAPLCDQDNSISHTTRRLMGILERCSTPSREGRTPQVRADAGRLSGDASSVSLLGRTIDSSAGDYKHRELHISHLPTLLKLKRGARLRESTRAARQMADAHSPVLAPYPPPARTQPAHNPPTTTTSSEVITSTPMREWTKQTNKMKSQVGRNPRKGTQNNIETEILPPLNLPEATLTIDQSNLPKFSFGGKTSEVKSTSQKVAPIEPTKTGYKFSTPTPIIENHINVPSDRNFKFSNPVDASGKTKISNGPFNFGATAPEPKLSSTSLENKSESKGWKCDDCWIQNKDADEKCVACTGPKPTSKKSDIVKDWQCKDCWVYNKNAVEKCIACGGTKQSDSKNSLEMPTFNAVKPAANEWRCGDCWVQNKPDILSCVACGGSKPPDKKTKHENEKKTEVVKDWQCKDCWVFNKDAVQHCIACGGSKPTAKVTETQSFTGFTKKQTKQWTCSDCWVTNDDNADKCIACGGTNPKKNSPENVSKSNNATDTFAELVKKQTELWECPSCLTRNNDSVSKCVCCEATRPGSIKNEDTKFNFSSTPAFKFGIPTQTETPKVSDNKPKDIAVESNNNNPPKTVTFTFGVAKPIEDSEKKNEVKEPPKYSFGAPTVAQEKSGFKFSVPEVPATKTDEKLKNDTSKSEIDGAKPSVTSTTDKVETAPTFKLPTANSPIGSLFTFKAPNSTDLGKTTTSEPVSKPAPTPAAMFGVPTAAKTMENSTPPASLFGVPSTAAKTTQNSTLFGIPSTAKTESANTSGNANATLFGVAPTAKAENTNASLTVFGVPTTANTDTNKSGTLFGISSAKPDSSLAVSKPDLFPSTTGAFATAKADSVTSQTSNQPSLFSFGSTSQANSAKPPSSRFNFTFGSTSNDPPPVFNSSFGAKPVPAFGAPNTQANAPAPTFGSLTTQANTGAPTFGSLTTQANTGVPTFGSLTTQASIGAPAFGSLTTQANTGASTFGGMTSQTSVGAPTFGGLTTQASTGAPTFGGMTSQTNVGAPTFGSLTTQANTGAPTFGSLTTQANTFGGMTTQANVPPPAFGAPTTQANTSVSNSFALPNKPLFGSPQGNLFGSSNQSADLSANKFQAPASKAFQFGTSIAPTPFGTQQQATMFGSPAPTNTSTELFQNTTQNMFNAPANPMGGMFGANLGAPPTFGVGNSGAGLPAMGQQQSALGQGLGQQSAPLGQPPAFNFGAAAPVFGFGQQTGAAAPGGMYAFGATPAPSVQFNLGTSTGTPQTSAPGARRLRKAVRRTQR